MCPSLVAPVAHCFKLVLFISIWRFSAEGISRIKFFPVTHIECLMCFWVVIFVQYKSHLEWWYNGDGDSSLVFLSLSLLSWFERHFIMNNEIMYGWMICGSNYYSARVLSSHHYTTNMTAKAFTRMMSCHLYNHLIHIHGMSSSRATAVMLSYFSVIMERNCIKAPPHS